VPPCAPRSLPRGPRPTARGEDARRSGPRARVADASRREAVRADRRRTAAPARAARNLLWPPAPAAARPRRRCPRTDRRPLRRSAPKWPAPLPALRPPPDGAQGSGPAPPRGGPLREPRPEPPPSYGQLINAVQEGLREFRPVPKAGSMGAARDSRRSALAVQVQVQGLRVRSALRVLGHGEAQGGGLAHSRLAASAKARCGPRACGQGAGGDEPKENSASSASRLG